MFVSKTLYNYYTNMKHTEALYRKTGILYYTRLYRESQYSFGEISK